MKKSVEIRRGVSWSKDQEHPAPRDGAVPVIRISNVQERLELDDLLYLSGVPEKARRLKRASKGWSILVGSNGNRQRIGNAVYQTIDADFLFASFLIAAKPREDSGIMPEFFFRWLTTDGVQQRITASAEGSTGLSNLAHDFFRAMQIAFPAPSEQAAIARILDAADSAIESTRVALSGARRLRRGLNESLVRGLIPFATHVPPKSGRSTCVWTREPLAAHIIDGPTNGLYRPDSDYGHDGTPIVRIDSFGDGTIHRLDSLFRVRLKPVEEHRYGLRPRDVLINRVNSMSHIGKAAIVPPLREATVFESNMMRLRTAPSLVPEFLTMVLCSDVARAHWLARAKPAVNQASINQRDVRDFRVPVPPPELQEEAVRRIERIDALIASLTRSAIVASTVKRGLMQDLLTGRVRTGVARSAVPGPNGAMSGSEPARRPRPAAGVATR